MQDRRPCPSFRSDRIFRRAVRTAWLCTTAVASLCATAATHDILIRNGRILDGSGNPWFRADIAIDGDRIVAVGDLAAATATEVIDASGLYVAPGFIDTHTHADSGLVRASTRGAETLLAQGLTTVLLNPDGGGPVDLARQRAQLLAHGIGVNAGQMIGHGSIRSQVMGEDQDRAPTAAELDTMRELVRVAMQEGAFALSTGPFYAPGSFSDTAELIELARVAAAFGGAYQSHIRDESDYTIGVVAAVDEVIEIARVARLPGIVTHIKVLGPRVWGYSAAIVQRIETARAAGIEVWADQYPYTASSTSLAAALLPRWSQLGGREALRARLLDPEIRARIRAEMLVNLERRGGAGRIQIGNTPDPLVSGKTLALLARERDQHPVDTAIDILLAASPGIISHNMDERDLERFMRQPWTMTASDGSLPEFGAGTVHPRGYGSFTRKLRTYAFDRAVLDPAAAVRSMTHLPATVYRISDRGSIRSGAFADIVIFDVERLAAPADYANPHQRAEGMVHVLVNGGFAIRDSAFTGARHGRVIKK
jgi:N-acyl-D-aspartate/D-glutamate deacylase